jgi:uncharacterized protein YecT (DUF1311 family)
MQLRSELVAAVAAVSFLALPAKADDPERAYSATYVRCEKANTVDAEVAACAYQEDRRQTVEMLALYHRLLKEVRPDQRSSLRASQRAWAVFRKAQCAYELSGDAGGTLQEVDEQECKLRMTWDRKLYLQKRLDLDD